MSINTTTRPVHLSQLDEEVRVAAGLDERPGLSASTTTTPTGLTETQVRCDHPAITQKLLDAVIDAHVPEPPKTVPTVEELARLLDETLDLIFTEVL